MMMYPKPEKKPKEKKPYNSLQRRSKEKKPVRAWKEGLFDHYKSNPNRADRAKFPDSVVKTAIERSGGICEYCHKLPCSSTHHVVGRGRSGRGVLSNAFRACGYCHIEIEGSEEKKQELISLYTERYGDNFWFDEQDWDVYHLKQSAIHSQEEAKRHRIEELEPIVTLLSTAAGRKLRASEIRLLDGMDSHEADTFAKLMHDVVSSMMPTESKSYGYGVRFED
jgi:hypothetical protein